MSSIGSISSVPPRVGSVPVQSISGFVANNTHNTATFAAPVAGNKLVLVVMMSKNASESVISITQSNVAWSKLHALTAAAGPCVEVWVGAVSGSAGTTADIYVSNASDYVFWWGWEFAGMQGVLDTYADATVASATYPIDLPTIVPSQGSALVVWALVQNSGGTAATRMIGSANNLYSSGFPSVSWAFPGRSPVIITALTGTAAAGVVATAVSIL